MHGQGCAAGDFGTLNASPVTLHDDAIVYPSRGAVRGRRMARIFPLPPPPQKN